MLVCWKKTKGFNDKLPLTNKLFGKKNPPFFMENNPKLITGINDNIKIVMASKFLFFINRKIIAGNNINKLSYLEIIKKKDER